ncbi:hypothetical protein [Pontibacter burrus]|uniref:Uncharacterized protein n=1 Tax=Pontibacter burrus TaxID=2704466 RepID=A0A6B3LRI9_9BACT|nr:hypothetical protein [Pontibacter burrus]NEM97665.1 hypothetical protein [Pontibacter burrus]
MPDSRLLALLQETESDGPVSKFTTGTIVAESEAILKLAKDQLVPVNQQLLQQIPHSPDVTELAIVASPASALKENGLHTIFTAGP